MPVYVYQCPCGHLLEVSHGMSEEPTVTCPECVDCVMVRRPAVAAVTFTGTGWGKDS